ncbi:MAG: penicillin-binding protein [Chloroflexi bacterium]|nr:penicillin-binding protein [Chloroflexota bacterium]
MDMGQNGRGVTPGRYRAYRFAHHDGRLSRRPGGAVASVGSLAGAFGIILAVAALFAGTAAASVITFFTSDLPEVRDLETAAIPLSTLIYDRSGEHLLYRLEDERRELITLDQVPEKMQQATIAIEDKTFWTNPGIDVGGIVRAAQANLQSGGISQGGSTITQQLIKTRLLGDEPTFTRKIKEAILAIEVARTYDKKKILEMYFNQIYYGNQAYGIKAAAATYFAVGDLQQLTLGQMALLAGLPQLPSEYDPVQNPASAKGRRAAVLDAMKDAGFITSAESEQAKDEPIKVKQVTTVIDAPHFVFRVREQLAALFGERAAYRGGYKVYSSLDWNMQQLAEKEVKDHVASLKGANVNNASMITMEPTTGEILAYVGSVDYYNNSPKVRGDYDSAGIAYRQPGSTFKIFTYLTGMQKAGLTAASILNDIEFCMGDGSTAKWCPKNAPTNGWSPQNGPISLRQAIRESVNLPAISVGRMVGVDAMMDTVAQLGIRRDWGDRSRYGLSFAIGAGELRLIDMVSAYQVVANMGVRAEPTFINRILDSEGKVIKDYGQPEGRRVLDAGTAYVFADILKDNTDPNGSWLFGPWTSIGRPAGLKTGTTDNLQDVWAIGFTPQRLTGIWMGNADNDIMYGITSAMGPGVLWKDYMTKVVGGLPVVWYEKPDNVVNVTVCVNPALRGGNGSGKLPGPNCPAGFRRNEIFVKGTEPRTNDSDVYLAGGCYKLTAHFADWQGYANTWAAGASKYSAGRFSGPFCGIAAAPSGSPSASPGASASAPSGRGTPPPPAQTTPPPATLPPTPAPTKAPPPTKKP